MFSALMSSRVGNRISTVEAISIERPVVAVIIGGAERDAESEPGVG